MNFESPDVMRDFPGLYSSENKTSNNDTDCEESGKGTRKDILIGKKKDKKDKKDKEKGYATLEGESSAEENCDSRSPSKNKKVKSFKFSKSKEKREKSKEKDSNDKKKDRERKVEKDKTKSDKKDRKHKVDVEGHENIDGLPIFGVDLKDAIERSKCHDGIDIPLPIRACINYIQATGLHFENLYKINTPKSKVVNLKKMYNHREMINLHDYDITTVSCLLKIFLRDLPEPIFTSELIVRFEEAGAIINIAMREKHLKILVNNLPPPNRLVLSWIIVHLHNVVLNEKHNKMSAHHIASIFGPVLQISQRLLVALLCHCNQLFPSMELTPYVPPLMSTAQLPNEPVLLTCELKKQESLLNQIHYEMNSGFIFKQREELLWGVQRIITQIKRQLKILTKDKDTTEKTSQENLTNGVNSENVIQAQPLSNSEEGCPSDLATNDPEENLPVEDDVDNAKCEEYPILMLQMKNNNLLELKHKLAKRIQEEKSLISSLKDQIVKLDKAPLQSVNKDSKIASLDEVMNLLKKENQILQITKINLVRQVMEQQEMCIDLKIKIEQLK